jgi:hypothetical protein
MHYRFWGLKIFATLCSASKIFSEGLPPLQLIHHTIIESLINSTMPFKVDFRDGIYELFRLM